MPGRFDPMPLLGFDHLELVVGNALQAAAFYVGVLGFEQVARAGLETGVRDRTSIVVRQGRVRIVLTGALGSRSPIAAHHRRHGDGVRDVALTVPDARHAFAHAVAAGAPPVREPEVLADEHGEAIVATVATFGDTVHTFVERAGYGGPFLPGYEAAPAGRDGGLVAGIDHVVGNVDRMDPWVAYYERVLGMRELSHFSDRDISTEYSALMSKVVTDGSGRIKLPINEPAEGRRRSQIEEFLEFYEGPGVQHVALSTRDIVAAMAELRARGVAFLQIPDAYYDDVAERVPAVASRLEGLRAQGVLVDRDDEGHLLQAFTAPVGDRPTLFLELIERHGARGFGDGNFRALFEALEREQARRGNL